MCCRGAACCVPTNDIRRRVGHFIVHMNKDFEGEKMKQEESVPKPWPQQLKIWLLTVVLIIGLLALTSASQSPLYASSGGILPNFAVQGNNQIRLLVGAFDPLVDPLPTVGGVALVNEATLPPTVPQYWLVQVNNSQFVQASSAITAAGGLIAGAVPDNTYMVRATPAQATVIEADTAVRWLGYYQPAWRIPIAVNNKAALLDLPGSQTYRIHIFRADPNPAAVAQALATLAGVEIVTDAGYVIDVKATAVQVPVIAAISAVEWIGIQPTIELHNGNGRWVNDTGVRDVYAATAPGRLTGAGQTAAIADTGINYTYDLNGRAHVAFRDCDADGSNCKQAIYTQLQPGTDVTAMTTIVDNNTGHRKMVAYFDLGATGPNPFDTSSHGSHTGGSITGDQGSNGIWDGHDGMAPGAMHVHQNVGTSSGGLALPSDDYQLWRQAYRPHNPANVPTTSPATGNVADYANYLPLEDARTHNNSYGLIAPIVDEGSAVALDQFVWDHEDMVIVVSTGNGGPGPFSISTPSVAKNNLSSGAMANGRQPMVSIDSMASFSSHGPTGDGRLGTDLATPGQIVVSVKGGTVDGYHVAQGTSMSSPILTGLSTLVRQYFYDGYGPANGSGFPGGTADASRSHNPSAALVKATLINGAERMRGFYSGDDGTLRALDGQWPSAGQGFGRVNLDNSLYFSNDALNNWYHDVWRADADAFPLTSTPIVREYNLNVQASAPFDVSLVWTDAPNLLPAGTPALVNNLNLEVVDPNGTIYSGNNMNSRLIPSVAVAETLAGAGAPDLLNPAERVRIAVPQAGVYTIRVIADRIQLGNQGFALAASGHIAAVGSSFTPGPGLQVDVPGAPLIANVALEPISADTAVVTFTTSEPTTAQAEVAGNTYIDSYNVGPDGFVGLNAGTVETSADYANRPVLGANHEILLTGLAPGQSYSIVLTAVDLNNNSVQATAAYTSPATVFQADAPDIGQLSENSTSTNQWRTGTQLYAGSLDGDGILGAFMFRIPENALDPNDITGAAVQMVSAHDWMIRYTQDPVLMVDLLEETVEPIWGTQDYTLIHNATADARVFPETAHLRGAGYDYTFTFACSNLPALQNSLATILNGERQAAFRYESTEVPGTGVFSTDFGFNRRSNGPAIRPTLILYTDDNLNPTGAACDPNTPAPTISNLGIHDGLQPNSVTVSWETDVDANSLILFREQGTSDWTQVGSPALTQVHHVQVMGLDSNTAYEFVVRSAACNGATTTDSNNGTGYDFFRPPPPPPPPTDDFWFRGQPDDQITKAAGPPFNNTFNQSQPLITDVPTEQLTTPIANSDFVGNPLAAFWVGPYNGTINGDVELRWHWSTGNATALTLGAEVEVTFFADPDFNAASLVQPEKIIGRATDRLTFTAAGVPELNISHIPVSGMVNSELLIQVVPIFIDTGQDLKVHYNSSLLDSGFGIPTGSTNPGPSQQLPRTGPVPPPSAEATNLQAPATRTGPATAADIAAGTGFCTIPEATDDPGDDGAKTIGGGWLAATDGKKINFSFNAQEDATGFSGNLQLNDKTGSAKIDVTTITAISQVNGSCGSVPAATNAVEFQGSGTYNDTSATFRVCVQDNAEPGKDNDLFYLECTSGCSYDTGSRTADDIIDGGNIQVHQGANGDSGGSSGSASTLQLNPVLLSEGVVGQLQPFTAVAYNENQDVLANTSIVLTQVAADGSTQTFTALTDATGAAVFSIANLIQTAEYIATSGAVESNAIEVTPLTLP